MNNLSISGTILKEKTIDYAREIQVEDFMLQMDGLQDGIYLESQAYAVENTADPCKSLQSVLDNLKSFDPTLVPNCTTAEEFTDADHSLSPFLSLHPWTTTRY